MRFVIIIIFLTVYLFSKNLNDFCYSIQIASFQKATLKDLQKIPLAKNCAIVKIQNGYSIRCECLSKKEIDKKLLKYKKKIPKAFIVKTQKSAFNTKTADKTDQTQKKIKEEKPKSLSLKELMYRVFIYSNDLKNAYKVAYEELKKDPKSLIWRRRVADILLWSGKSKEALREYYKIYKKSKDKELEKIIYKTSIEGREYEKAYNILKRRLLLNPNNRKYLKEFIELSYKTARLKESAKFLDKIYKKTKRADILKNSAFLYYKTGDIKKAKKRLLLLKKSGMLDIESAKLLSEIFFIKKDLNSALEALLSVKEKVSLKDKDYWHKLSSLYEYLNQPKKAMNILYTLCFKGGCDREDYDRLIRYFYEEDKKRALKISYRAFKKLQEPSYFIYYAKILLELDKPKKVYEELLKLSWKMKKKMENLPSFWLVKANLYEKIEDFKKADFCYKKALSLDKNSSEILAQYANFLLFIGDELKFKKVIKKIEKKAKQDSSFYIVLASLYYSINEPQKALKYYKKALNAHPLDINLKIAYAKFLEAIGKKREALNIFRKLYIELRKRFKNDKTLLKKKAFLIPFLDVSIYFLDDAGYRKLLKVAKKILPKEEYKRYEFAYAVYKDQKEYAKYLARDIRKRALWLRLYLALDDKERLKDLLYRYSSFISLKEKVDLYIKTGDISKAMAASFEAREKYPENRKVYKQNYKLSKTYGNKFDTEIGYKRREELRTSYIKLENLYYLFNRYYFGTSLEADRHRYGNVFEEYEAKMWLKVLTNSGFFKLGGAYKDNEGISYGNYFFRLYSKIGNGSNVNIKAYKSAKSDESVGLLLCGRKDGAEIDINYFASPRLSFLLSLGADRYELLNGKFLGKGYKTSLTLFQKLRFAYPDIAFKEFITLAKFKEQNDKYLPSRDYAEGGVGVLVGRDFEGGYSYRWRPYMDLTLLQNSLFGFSYAASVGASGKFFGGDNLNISVNYNRSAGSFNDELWFLRLKHNYLY